jgi:hypothetical protein
MDKSTRHPLKVARMMRFPEGLYRQVERLAHEHDLPVNTEILMAVREHVKREERKER